MSSPLVLILLVGAAYVLTNAVVGRMRRRWLAATGIGYVALGVVLGPVVSPNLQLFSDLTALAPVIAFGTGWVGLLYGMELEFGRALPERSLRLAVVDAGLALAVVWPASAWILGRLGVPDAALCAFCLGCVAMAGSSTAVEAVEARHPGLRPEILGVLRRGSRLGSSVAMAVFGLAFCLFHHGSTSLPAPPTPSDWVLLTAGLGLALALLFAAFLGDSPSEDSLFLTTSGILLLASGAAFFLNLSALAVNLVLGLVLAQTRHGAAIREALARTQHPVSVLLLLFAGALWTPVPILPGLSLTGALIGLRLLAKLATGVSASLGTPLRADVSRGLLAQGDVAVAMAISMRLAWTGPGIDLAYTAMLASILVFELVSPRVLRGLLVDAGELADDGPLPAGAAR
jgi:hypothetical protein